MGNTSVASVKKQQIQTTTTAPGPEPATSESTKKDTNIRGELLFVLKQKRTIFFRNC